MTEGFIFYGSFMKALETLNDQDRLDAYDMICRYALYGEEPTGTGPALGMFYMAQAQIDANTRRRENGMKGGRPKNQTETKAKPKQNQTETKAKPKEKEKVKDKEKEKEKEIKEKESRFAPPSVEEVAEYCRSRGNDLDPEGFVAFYQSKGWKVGNNPMKDWKAAIVSWEKRRKEERKQSTPSAKPRTTFHNFPQRDDAEHKANIARLIASQT